MTARQIEGERATLVDVLRAAARVNADVEAYVEPAVAGRSRRTLTFSAWDRAADGVAGRFAALGVGPGTVVCLLVRARSTTWCANAAAVRLGAVTSGINCDSVHRRSLRSSSARARRDRRRRRGRSTAGTRRHRSEPAACLAASGETSPPVADVSTRRIPSPWCGQRHHRAAQGRRLRPRQPPGRGDRDRRPVRARRPAAVPAAVRPRRVDDQGVGRGGPRHHHRHHPESVEGVRRRAGHGGRAHHRRPGRSDPVGPGAGPAGARDADLSSLRIAGTGASRVPAELVAAMRDALRVPVVVRYTSTEASLGTGTCPATRTRRWPPPWDVRSRVVADGGRRGGPTGGGGGGRPGPAAVGRRHARLLGWSTHRAGCGRTRPRPCPPPTRCWLTTDG